MVSRQTAVWPSELPRQFRRLGPHVHSILLFPRCQVNIRCCLIRFTESCDKYHIADFMSSSLHLHQQTPREGPGHYHQVLDGWHMINQAQWYGGHNWVSIGLTAAKRNSTHFRASHFASCLYRTPCLAKCPSSSFHTAGWALALTCFFTCCYLGELTIPSKDNADLRYHVLASADVKFSHSREDARSSSFNIPWTMTTREHGAKVIVTARPDETICPVKALFIHLKSVNQSCPRDMPLLFYHSPSGAWTPMVKKTSLDFCDSVRKAALSNLLITL